MLYSLSDCATSKASSKADAHLDNEIITIVLGCVVLTTTTNERRGLFLIGGQEMDMKGVHGSEPLHLIHGFIIKTVFLCMLDA